MKLIRPKSLTDLVVEEMRARIIDGRLRLGQALSESALATDLGISKTGPASIVAGNPLIYTITLTNTGPSDAAGVVVSDPTPNGLSFTSSSGDCTTCKSFIEDRMKNQFEVNQTSWIRFTKLRKENHEYTKDLNTGSTLDAVFQLTGAGRSDRYHPRQFGRHCNHSKSVTIFR